MAVMRRVIEDAALAERADARAGARANRAGSRTTAIGPAAFAESAGGDGRDAALGARSIGSTASGCAR